MIFVCFVVDKYYTKIEGKIGKRLFLAKTQRAPRLKKCKFEARNPKYETNSNDIISNLQN